MVEFAGIATAVIGLGVWFIRYLISRNNADVQKNTDQRDQAVAGLQEIDKAQRARDAADARPGGLRDPAVGDVAPRGGDGIS